MIECIDHTVIQRSHLLQDFLQIQYKQSILPTNTIQTEHPSYMLDLTVSPELETVNFIFYTDSDKVEPKASKISLMNIVEKQIYV